jgi:hypothetical protein
MSQTDYTPIAFGPGGLILGDGPANQELLGQIEETDPLSPENLLKLAAFYVDYSTNEQLGNHLALIALTKLVNDAQIHKLLTGKTSPAAIASLQEIFEDILDGSIDEKTEPHSVKTPNVWSIPFSGVGLLIEAGVQALEGGYYVIGVSPLNL